MKQAKGFGGVFSWDKNSPPPELPPQVVAQTRAKYLEAYEWLTGRKDPGQRS